MKEVAVNMNKYVIGVDGGGTKTHCALYKANDEKVDMITWEPMSHETFEEGFITLKSELDRMLAFMLEKNSLTRDQISYAVFGLTGVDTLRQHKTISRIITELRIKNFTLCNDAYLGIKAASNSGIGICAINGTGCNVVGIDQEGNSLQIGGIGNVTGDKGGGNYLSAKIISSIYNSLFREGQATMLTDSVFEILKIQTKYQFIDVLTQKIEDEEIKLSDFNPLIFTAANKGDELSLNILHKMGEEYARSINGIIHHLNYNEQVELDVILAGSVFVKGTNQITIETLKEKVQRDNPKRKFNFTLLREPPVMGAIKWAIERL